MLTAKDVRKINQQYCRNFHFENTIKHIENRIIDSAKHNEYEVYITPSDLKTIYNQVYQSPFKYPYMVELPIWVQLGEYFENLDFKIKFYTPHYAYQKINLTTQFLIENKDKFNNYNNNVNARIDSMIINWK